MLLIPKIFNPKNRNDFPKMSKDFKTLWVELTLPCKNFPSLLVNVSYNPKKSKTDIFLEELALQIDYGITKKQKNLLLGDFNTNYLHPNERKKIDKILALYGLPVVNKTPTRGKNLIDIVIKDHELPHSKVFTFESPITSEHKYIAMITNVTMSKKQPPRRKTIFYKSKYCKRVYLQELKQIDWDVLYTASDAEYMCRIIKKILTEVIRYHAPLKTVFIRTEKSKIKLKSNDFIKSILKKADSEKTKWNIKNDSRNSTKFSQNIFYLINCFDDVITDNYKMAQLRH